MTVLSFRPQKISPLSYSSHGLPLNHSNSRFPETAGCGVGHFASTLLSPYSVEALSTSNNR